MNIGDLLVKVGNFVTSCGDEWNMVKARQDRLAREAGVSLDVPERPIIEVTDEMREVIIAERPRYSETDWLRVNGPRDQLCVRYNLTGHQVRGVLSQYNRAVNNANGNGNGERAEAPSPTVEPSPVVAAAEVIPVPEVVPVPEVTSSPELQTASPAPEPAPEPVQAPEPAPVLTPEPAPAPEPAPEPLPAAVVRTRPAVSTPVQVDLSNITLNVNTWPRRIAKTGSTTPTAKEYETDETDRHILLLLKERNFPSNLMGKFREHRRLTRYQVIQLKDSVLAETPVTEPPVVEPPVVETPAGITADPTSWPEISPPTRFRIIDDTDREIVRTIDQAGVYDLRRNDVMQKRSLNRQQVAGILASMKRAAKHDGLGIGMGL